MIFLSDFSQMVIASVAVQSKDMKGADVKDLIKHVALSQLLAIRKKFKSKIIICCDSRKYWRKEEFQWYKGHRKHHKDNDFLDWTLVYETLNELIVELKDSFPYIVLDVPNAEADDIIACLVKYFDENELASTGLIEEPQEVIIGSTDQDFMQLQKYRNVRQWNSVQKKFMECKNPKQFLIEHICKGDIGDNIGNICTPDSWSRDRADNVSTRAKPFATARLPEFYNKGYGACKNEDEQRNFRRNEKLVDFDFIPSAVHNSIINTYMNYEVKGNKQTVFKYLQDHRMKLLLSNSQDF